MDLKELENGVDPDSHWYYQSKKLPLLRAARRALAGGKPLTIVDIGSGSGFFALELEKEYGPKIAQIYLVDIGYSEAEMAPTRGTKVEKVHAIPARIENGLVVLMDVLEHLENDLQMLQSVKSACVGDNNSFFITVPAFKSLWSGHDVFLGHYGRCCSKLASAKSRIITSTAGFFRWYGRYADSVTCSTRSLRLTCGR
jgi:SAM-dependent methyltransferase